MAFNVKILKRAELEVNEAIVYYKDIQPKLAERFLTDYQNHLKTLKTIPYFEIKYQEIRKISLKKFPYTIHFSVDELSELVLIHAVTCDYQNPETTNVKP